MEKEFCTYEQALDLKELGFDEPCLTYYHENQRLESEIVFIKGSKFWNLPDISEIAAPTYSQAFRWFREKYNLDSFIKHLYKSTIKVGYYFGIDEYKGVEFYMDFDDYYKTYEEAESACLDKLIQIVKNNYNNC